MTKMPESPMPFWVYYINVADIDATHASISANGGKVIHGPSEVPGGMWIANCRDPQGAVFSLVAPKR